MTISELEPPPDTEAFVREPVQARSRRTLERLMRAAGALLEQGGVEAVTVTGVAQRARTSVGSFYARFAGRDDMIRYLGERSLEQAIGPWAEADPDADAGSDPEAPIEALFLLLYRQFREGPARTVALLDGEDDPEPTRLARFEDAVAQRLSDHAALAEGSPAQRRARAVALIAGVAECAKRGVELGEEALASLFASMAGAAGAAPPEPSEAPAPEPPAEPADEAPAAHPSPEPEPEGEVDPFDVWG